MKKLKFKWVVIILVPIICLLLLYRNSINKPIIGDFERKFTNYSTSIVDSVQFRTNIFSVIISNDKVYANDGLTIIEKNFIDDSSKIIVRKNDLNIKEPIISFGLDSSYTYYRISNDEKIYLKHSLMNSFKPVDFKIFAGDIIKLDNNNFLLQQLLPLNGATTLKIFNVLTKSLTKVENILPKVEGGFMLTSGKWISNTDTPSKTIFLTCFYLDDIFMFNSKGVFLKTIKPIDSVKEKTEVIKVGDRYTYKGGTRQHRYTATANNQFLYVASSVLSSNEDADKWKNNSVIDVYSLPKGDYKYSFYIPKYKGKKLTDIIFFNQKNLYVLYKNEVIKYKIDTDK